MELHGEHLIGNATSLENPDGTLVARNPATGDRLEPAYAEATADEVDRAARLADAAFDPLRGKSAEQIAAFLEGIADRIVALDDALLERANAETGLPMQRLTMERGRTVNQTRLFAALVREGSWVDARIDRGDPERKPMPKPDVRSMRIGIGPVAVFGASNFPFAISVAGTDTISALAAGCPVVVKAHPAHPGTCEMIGRAIVDAGQASGMPEGVFSMVHGAGHEVGMALVRHPLIKAVGFTGSLRGGRALFDAAAARPSPIPVYAEMGSVNPVFVLPGALEERGERIAEGYIQSVTMGVGQFCTNPGMVFGAKGDALSRFTEAAGRSAGSAAAGTMLHEGIGRAYRQGVERIERTAGVSVAGRSGGGGDGGTGATGAPCVVFTTDLRTLQSNEHLNEEVFGPSSIIVSCDAAEELERVAEGLDGHLTATIHGTDEDLARHGRLVTILQRKVGRLVFNGFPTGIEVCAAMHHGGPYPATTDPHFTSIGTAAIHRFARPICYQNFPDAALPPELRNRNERGIWRLVDNELTREDG